MDCCVFVGRKWRQQASLSRRLGYLPLSDDEADGSESLVTVVVGKEKRVFVVDPFVLEKDPFRVLLETMRQNKKGKTRGSSENREVIFIAVDAILFEHMLWLMVNDWPSFLHLNLSEIIDFYAQDS
ncbi:auxin-responsive protein SAUR78-like [Magnolia sinica]|uniref:auxin-responsive protein SAUR78-like n=1 Tax=Magnolia sinica TaxID=86752 RepID=UPI0026598B96|nr:auxin-responsive protein SAUR78-like [Magnolia sinica]